MGERKRREAVRKNRVAEFEARGQYASWMDVLDAWDLLAPDPPVNRLSLGEWEQIGEAIQRTYVVPEQAVLGSLALGLFEGAGFSDGRQPLAKIAPHALVTERVWLPDPLYSALSPEASRLSAQFGVPEPFTSNGTYIQALPSYCVWNAPTAERLALLRARMPATLARIQQLRPLIACGAIRLSPWEHSARRYEELILRAVSAIQEHSGTRQITEQYRQDQYTLGIYFGGMGFATGGAPAWFSTKRPMVVYGALNATYAADLGASFLSLQEGDREVFDFITAQGHFSRPGPAVASMVDLPDFSAALLPDIVAIRNDSESLSLLREVMTKAAEMDEIQATQAIESRLREVAEKIKEETGLWRTVKGQATQLSVGVLAALGLGQATGAEPLVVIGSATAGALPGVVALFQAVREAKRRAGRGRAELLIRIAEKMAK